MSLECARHRIGQSPGVGKGKSSRTKARVVQRFTDARHSGTEFEAPGAHILLSASAVRFHAPGQCASVRSQTPNSSSLSATQAPRKFITGDFELSLPSIPRAAVLSLHTASCAQSSCSNGPRKQCPHNCKSFCNCLASRLANVEVQQLCLTGVQTHGSITQLVQLARGQ